MKNLNPFKSLLILLMFFSFNSISRDKIIALGNFRSFVDDCTNSEFREAVINTLDDIYVHMDTTSTDQTKSDYILSGKITTCNNGRSCINIEFRLVDSKSHNIVETYNEPMSRYYEESNEYMIEKALLSMNEFKIDEEWDNSMMPGVSYQIYQPRNSDLGFYQGPSVDFVFYSRSKKTMSDLRGPSRMKYFGKIGILNAESEEINDLLLVSGGMNLSFEAKTNRNYMLPYFGIEIGGLYSKDISTFQFTPLMGCQLISTKKIIWSVQGGYLYSAKRFDEYSGYNLSTSVNILLWK